MKPSLHDRRRRFRRLDRRLIVFCLGLATIGVDAAMPQDAETEVFGCVINPARMVKLGSAVSGILSTVSVDRGDVVRRGDIVATLNVEVEKVAVEISRTRAESTAEIDAQIARNDLILKELERTEELVKKEVATAQKLDAFHAELVVGLLELERLKLQHKLAQLDAEKADRMLQQRILRSPVDGIVHERALTEGEFVSDAYESYVLVIAQLDPLFVETRLPVEYFSKLRVGQPGRVRTNGEITGTFDAKVTVIDRVFDAASKTFGVRLVLPNPGYTIPAGQICQASF